MYDESILLLASRACLCRLAAPLSTSEGGDNNNKRCTPHETYFYAAWSSMLGIVTVVIWLMTPLLVDDSKAGMSKQLQGSFVLAW